MLFQCWASVIDAGPTLKQHWVRVSSSVKTACSRLTIRLPVQNPPPPPSKHELFIQCWHNVVSVSQTMVQHCANIGRMHRAYWPRRRTDWYIVVKAAYLSSQGSRVRPPLWHSQLSKKHMFLPRSFVKVQNIGESFRDRLISCSASDGLALRILHVSEGDVVSFSSPSSGGFTDPV